MADYIDYHGIKPLNLDWELLWFELGKLGIILREIEIIINDKWFIGLY
jgi:hypothetical protein